MANKTLTLSPASQAYLVEHSVREPEILQRLGAETAGDGMSMIDADKTNYSSYYERVLTLLRSGSLIAVDNTLWGVRVINNKVQSTDTQAIRQFNDRLRGDLRVPLSLSLVGDGLSFTLTLKNNFLFFSMSYILYPASLTYFVATHYLLMTIYQKPLTRRARK